MREFTKLLDLNLFLFDGSAATTAAASTESSESSATGDTVQDAAVQTGDNVQDAAATENQQEAPEDLEAEFEKLIKGKYKGAFGKRTQNIVQDRLKGSKEALTKLEQYEPAITAAMERYGVKDVSELPKAIATDELKLEHDALERGMSLDQLRTIREIEYDNKVKDQKLAKIDNEKEAAEKTKRQKAEQDKMFKEWSKEEKTLQKDFPKFSIANELDNSDFADMLKKGVSVTKAYYATHHNDIVANIAKHAVEKGKKDAVDTVRANGVRPSENISATSAPVDVFIDSSKLTDNDWAEIDRKIKNGESIGNIR